ncbi:MAG: hypothetical protein V1809_07065 [Planctomycetota bacterium]
MTNDTLTRSLHITKHDHRYIIRYPENEETQVLLTLIAYAESPVYNLTLEEVFLIACELGRRTFTGDEEETTRHFGTMSYRVS